MRFSTIVTGLIATACTTALAAPVFLPVGVLPSQPTTAEDVTRDMTNLETALGGFNKAVQDAIAGGKTGVTGTALDAALSRAIEYQAITQTARLNSKNIIGPFSPDGSASIVDKLKGLLSALQAGEQLLTDAKAGGVLGTFHGTVIKLYLELTSTDTVGYLKTLLPYIDTSVNNDATSTSTAINESLEDIGDILASK
ncbi:hypothetical protein CGRA01v4_04430 [Colletotrichum graminicola]|uniref:Cell wall protein n=1 Tax=Colletotrichum graminicola (strain M1.001 / M2 / FGSC 10212) TaxID=645133 RepID=E3Q9H8_COLGM|nr:uncharacterized protein GLRG_01852 [Colletotrichum graminicola M1.001]EFQ27357.1 hypothetical protein GLRG_01852 [Colletotrichum graminicola M1.001]WDK13149.1 hypothetical protein CGRA01v4_04430 [Colletotrichum graminicola]